MKTLLLCWTLAVGASALAVPAFENADFEKGDLSGWKGDGHWCVVTPDAAFPRARVSVHGMFSAVALSERGEGVMSAYEKQDCYRGPRVLLSPLVKVTDDYLVFSFRGVPLRAGKGVTAELLDGADKVLAVPFAREGDLASFDVSALRGRDVRLRVTAVNASASIDNVFFAARPVPKISAVSQDGRTTVTLSAALDATVRVRVLDYFNGLVLDESRPAKTGANVFEWKSALGRRNRVYATVTLADGRTIFDELEKVSPSSIAERRAVRIPKDGWTRWDTDDVNEELPLPGAAVRTVSTSPFKTSRSYFWRNAVEWKSKSAQQFYARTIDLVARRGDERVLFRLPYGGGGLFSLFVNGTAVVRDTMLQSYVNETFDMTDAVRAGTNEILIRIRNPRFYVEGVKEGSPVVPVFWHNGTPMCGLLGDGWIERTPSVAYHNGYIDSNLSEDRVQCRARFVNRSRVDVPVSVSARVYDEDGRLRGRMDSVSAVVPAGETSLVTNVAVVAGLPRWTPDTPRLLRLEISCEGPDGTDVVNERFGYREYSFEGRTFRLNGIPVSILEALTQDDEMRAAWKTWWGANAIRRPICPDQANAADEEGYFMRMVQEDIYPGGSVNNPPEPAASFDAPFKRLEQAQFDTYYNHPSLYMFCLGNELDGHGYFRAQTSGRYSALFGAIAAAFKSIDPVRPVCSSGDAIADFFRDRAWNVHYPHEYSIAHDLPRSGMLLSERLPLHVLDPNRPWDGKPVFCGENFSESGIGPYLAAFGGDLADNMPNWFRTWRDFFRVRSRAMRWDGISAIAPFTPINTLRNYYPVEIFPADYREQFDVGEVVSLPVAILHDVFVDERLDLNWALADGEMVLAKGALPLLVKAGARKVVNLPKVRLPKDESLLSYRLQLYRDGKPFLRWGTYEGTLAVVKTEAIVETPKFRRFRQAELPDDRRALREWVAAGNTLFVEVDRSGLLQVGGTEIAVVDHRDSHTFNVARHNPLMAGLSDNLLRYWDRETQRVMGLAMIRPESASCRTLCVSGDESGMRFASYLEESVGKGRILYSTLGSLPGFDRSSLPAYRRLLSNAARSARAATPARGKTLYVDARDANADVASLVRAAKKGARVVVARLTPQNVARFRPLVGEVALAKAPNDNRNALVAKAEDSPLLDSLTSEDFSWRRGRIMFVAGGKDLRTTITPMYDYELQAYDAPSFVGRKLTSPCVLMERRLGAGYVVVDQVRWPEAAAESSEALRTALTWYSNLGLVDIASLHSDAAENRSIDMPFKGSWSGGKNDLPLPLARKWFKAHPPAAILGSSSEFKANARTLVVPVPPIAARAERIVLDQANAFGYIDYSMGLVYATVAFTYADGTTEMLELRYGEHGDDVRVKSAAPLGAAKQVAVAERDGVSVYRTFWKNPRRDVDLKSVTVATADGKIVPILFGLAAELSKESKGPLALMEGGLWKLAARLRNAADDGRRIWAVFGPYDNEWKGDPERRPAAFDEKFSPEQGVNLRQQGGRFGGRPWKRYAEDFDSDRPDILRAMNPENILPFGTHTKERYVSYFYTKVYSPIRQQAIATIGSDDAFKLWLNGRMVREHFVLRGCRLGSDVCAVTLDKGWNTVLIKHLKMRLGAGIAFDLKPFDKDWQSISGERLGARPSMKLKYDAYAAMSMTIPDVFTIQECGQTKSEAGVHSDSGVSSFCAPDGSRGIKVDFACAGGHGIFTQRENFQRAGRFLSGRLLLDLMLFRDEPIEKAVRLVVRNAGGRHAGDALLELHPSPTGLRLVLRYEGETPTDDRVLSMPLPTLPTETWLPLAIAWGEKGLLVTLGGHVLLSQIDNHDKMFSTSVFTVLMGGPRMERGALAFRNVRLEDLTQLAKEVK